MLQAILLLPGLLFPPQPPRQSVAVTYGFEEGKLKGMDIHKLLNPPVVLHDDLFSLRDKDNAESLAHIVAENAYADAILEESDAATESVLAKLLSYARGTEDEKLWHRGAGSDAWEYAHRTGTNGPHPCFVRRPAGSCSAEAEQVILDANQAPALLPSQFSPGLRYLGSVRGVSMFRPSRSGARVAYTVDVTGEEKYACMIAQVNERTGAAAAPFEVIEGIDVDLQWGHSDHELFYATLDETGRPFRLHRYAVGGDRRESSSNAQPSMDAAGVASGFGRSELPKAGKQRLPKKKKKTRGGSRQPPSASGAATAGTASGSTGASTIVLEERDPRYRLSFRRSSDGSRLLVDLTSRDSTEIWALPLSLDGASLAGGEECHWDSGFAVGDGWHCLGPRKARFSYTADFGTSVNGTASYVIVAREDGESAEETPCDREGALYTLDESVALSGSGRRGWQPLTVSVAPPPGTSDGDAVTRSQSEVQESTGRSLMSVQCFGGVAAIEGRRNGASCIFLWSAMRASMLEVIDGTELLQAVAASPAALAGGAEGIDDDIRGLSADGQWHVQLCPSDEQNYESGRVRIELSTPLCPPRVVELTLATGELSQVWAEAPPPSFDPSRFRCGRLWVTAADGERIPISVLLPTRVEETEVVATGSGQRPVGARRGAVLYAYGSYGVCTDPGWDPERLALVDCGVAHAIAHVRGGGEMGFAWHAAGRRAGKATSFTDAVACAEAIVAAGIATQGAVAIEGRSAGGLLAGAALNLQPSLFCAMLASVPFLDAAGTLQDASLPLTANEWEEFGNPNEANSFDDVLAFSPVHNVMQGMPYPPCLLSPALQDARTGFWEATKYADAIRNNGCAQPHGPVLVRTDMEGGHFRPADALARARARAVELGFVLHHVQPVPQGGLAPDTRS